MKILVAIKRVVDYNVRVQIKRDGSGVATDGLKMSINPFDEIALEEALRIREGRTDTEILVVSIGSEAARQQLRTALAMGADRALLLTTEDESQIQPPGVARALLKLIEQESPDLVLMGKQAIDDDANQTGQMLAALWDRPQATFASKLKLAAGKITATREVDEGLEVIRVELPAVITTDLRLNTPRFVKMPDIMKAKRKPLEIRPLTELELEPTPHLETFAYAPPPKRQGGHKVDSVAALVAALKAKGVI